MSASKKDRKLSQPYVQQVDLLDSAPAHDSKVIGSLEAPIERIQLFGEAATAGEGRESDGRLPEQSPIDTLFSQAQQNDLEGDQENEGED